MNEDIKCLNQELKELRTIVMELKKKLTPSPRELLYARVDGLPKMDKGKLPI